MKVYRTAKDFIRRLLTLDPQRRPSASEALQDKWMTGVDARDVNILDAVRENFCPRRALRSAVGAVRAMNRLRTSISTQTVPDSEKSQIITATSQ